MKKLLVILVGCATVCALKANAQGTFNFGNALSGAVAPIHDIDGTTGLSGAAFAVDYFWGPSGIGASDVNNAGLQSGGQAVAFSNNGFFSGGTQAIQGQTGTVSLQYRAWRVSDGATFALANKPGGHVGESQVIQVTLAFGSPQPAPATPTGMQSFSLVANPVPEPSTIAMGLMGLGGLLIRRRK